MSDVTRWSTTAASNNFAVPDGWPENQDKATVNNCAREMMAALKRLVEGFPWLPLDHYDDYTIAKETDTQVSIANAVDTTAYYQVGRDVRVGNGSTWIYGVITSSSYSASVTYVNISLDNSLEPVMADADRIEVSIVTPDTNLANTENLPSFSTGELNQGENLLRDSGFEENNLANWDLVEQSGSFSLTNDERGGAIGLEYDTSSQAASPAYIYGNTSDRASLVGHAGCREGDAYVVEVWFKYTGTAPGGAYIGVGVSFRDETGAELAEDVNASATATTSWAKLTHLTAQAPANTAYVVPFIKIVNGSPNTVYHFDDASCRRHEIRSRVNGITGVASATTIAVPNNCNFFRVTGTTDIDTITGTYFGHLITMYFNGVCRVQDEADNIKLRGDFLAGAAGDTLTLVYDGTDWLEVSRQTTSLEVPDVASATTIAIPNEVLAVTISGSTSISTITVGTHAGRVVTLIGAAGTTAAIADGAGNCNLSAAWTFGAEDTITLVCDGTSWLEIARSNN